MQPQGHFQVVRRVVDDGDDPQAALDAPRWRVEDQGHVELEPGLAPLLPDLRARGHDVSVGAGPHGFGVGQMILRLGDALVGGSDGRGDGYAAGVCGGVVRAAAITVPLHDDSRSHRRRSRGRRTGLRLLLDREDDIEVVGEAGDGDAGVLAARLEKPDIVLLDVVMPGTHRASSRCAEMRRRHPRAKVLMLSMQDDPTYVREAFAAGARGYLLKEAADTELVQAVREVAAEEPATSTPTLGARLALAEVDAAQAGRSERSALRPGARGPATAWHSAIRTRRSRRLLFISVRTAETHRAHIMQKLGLTTRAELSVMRSRTAYWPKRRSRIQWDIVPGARRVQDRDAGGPGPRYYFCERAFGVFPLGGEEIVERRGLRRWSP